MNTKTHDTASSSLPQETDAASLAITDQARTDSLARVAELAEVATQAHIDEHIRGMVAATMGHLPPDASITAREATARWQQWALGVADGIAQGVPS